MCIFGRGVTLAMDWQFAVRFRGQDIENEKQITTESPTHYFSPVSASRTQSHCGAYCTTHDKRYVSLYKNDASSPYVHDLESQYRL